MSQNSPWGLGQWYNTRELPSGYTLAQIVDLAKLRGATWIRLYARYGMEPIDFTLLNQTLDMLATKGMRVLFSPFFNYQDHNGYFGSADWYAKLTDLGKRYLNDSRIWAWEIFNEPNSSTWSSSVTNIVTLQQALAKGIDALRSNGGTFIVVLPDQMVYGNNVWSYAAGTTRPNCLQAFHFWASTWAAANYATGTLFWTQWGLARITKFEAAYPSIKVIIDEMGFQDPQAGWASQAYQLEADQQLIKWANSTSHDFSYHLYGWNWNASGFYKGKADLLFPYVVVTHECQPGYHWDDATQACVKDVTPPNQSVAARSIGPFCLPRSVVHLLWLAREKTIRPEVHKKLHPLV